MDLMSLARINLREEKETDIEQAVADFFSEKKGIVDTDVHAFADSLGIEHSELEGVVYKLLNDFLAYGRWNDKSQPEYDADEFKMGLEVEKEHSINPIISGRIAKDHLAECKDYYTRLAKMESECGTDES